MLKTELEIDSYKSVGPIVFGSTRGENRKHFAVNPKTPAVVDGGMPGDHYEDLGIYVMYDKYNRCAGAECFRPSSVLFDGKNLLRHTYKELYDFFKQRDPNLVEGEMEFTSYKFGIAVFDPDHLEKPTDACQWIAVFRENYFNRKIGVTDPTIFSTFTIQPGFVEGIEEENKTYQTVEEAFSDMFRRNTESLIIQWNSFPVRFNYTADIPAMLTTWIEMISKVSTGNSGEHTLVMKSNQVEAVWNLSWTTDRIKIQSHWKKVNGDYEDVLNEYGEVNMLRSEFLGEWKMVLQQIAHALIDSACKINDRDAVLFMKKLKEVNKKIKHGGRFYTKETLELEF